MVFRNTKQAENVTIYFNADKLNSENYYIEALTANCEHGNGVRYISELYGKYGKF